MRERLDVAIGPVQGFVAESRRTRDLWGSSYLLSFLAGHAMRGAERAGGRVVRPVVQDDRLYRWIGGDRSGKPPEIGSLPNRFAVEVHDDAPAVAGAARNALDAAWRRMCDAVWEEFVADACERGEDTEAIWERQTHGFWEMVWAVDAAGTGVLARRKHWRTHGLPAEPGDKCTVMHDLQELSGHVRSPERNRFWEHLRGRVGELDIRKDERLCAVALVKRLFPRVSEAALGWPLERAFWPSTVHVAARPWLRRVDEEAPERARDYAELVRRFASSGVLSERRLPGLGTDAGDLPRLDANWFHREAVEDERRCPLKADAEDGSRRVLAEALNEIRIGKPSSFYALLLADGDRLGELVGRRGGERVGRGLSRFTGRVPGILRACDGETVYAGGDDVFAMLPAPIALQAAEKLAHAWRDAFDDVPEATLSAAVVFVHVRYPLSAAIREAHRLLDAVAKEANGRDSLAVGILNPGGLNAQWVTTWKRPEGGSAVALLGQLVNKLRAGAPEAGLSSALLYRIRDMLIRVGGWGSWRPGEWGAAPEGLDVLLRAEIGHSFDLSGVKGADEAAELVGSLLRRAAATGVSGIGVDALVLARFLAQDGGEA